VRGRERESATNFPLAIARIGHLQQGTSGKSQEINMVYDSSRIQKNAFMVSG
jgi:hypothetical protein